MAKKSTKKTWIYAIGRRRQAACRVRFFKGKEQNLVNGVPIGKYFPGEVNKAYWQLPFELTETAGKYYITAKVTGGGRKGQLDALVHGLARALVKLDAEKYRIPLKKAGLLTRDSRTRERRKVGMGGKSRRQKQSPKR